MYVDVSAVVRSLSQRRQDEDASLGSESSEEGLSASDEEVAKKEPPCAKSLQTSCCFIWGTYLRLSQVYRWQIYRWKSESLDCLDYGNSPARGRLWKLRTVQECI